VLTVVCAAATVPVFGELITDPIKTVEAIDSSFAILLGGLTFVIATVGINIVANFIAPAFDFSHVSPQKISWRTGGMIAAVGSFLLTPWNWYDSDQGIRFTLGILGSLIGPLFGILIAGYYLAGRQRIAVDDLYSMSPTGKYWFRGGYNPNAVIAVAGAGVPTVLLTLFASVGDYGWFIGCALGFGLFAGLERVRPMMPQLDPAGAGVSDGTRA
jgi:NCS1 family nucleobase:cation symporter-1